MLAKKWRRVSEAFSPLEGLYMTRRHAPKLPPAASQPLLPTSSSVGAQDVGQSTPHHHQHQGDEAGAGSSGSDALEAFSENLSRFAAETEFQVRLCPSAQVLSRDWTWDPI